MSKKFPRLNDQDLNVLHDALHRVRKNSQSVTVPKELLFNLLCDHADVVAKIGEKI